MKILVVDDEEKIRQVIIEYCIAAGYSCSCAENGLRALEKLRTEKFDLLILDIMMPEMDGFEVLKNLKNKLKIPTIILSARDQELDKLQGFDLGIDDYVTKPFSPKELIARIKAILKRSNALDNIYKLDTLEVNFSAYTLKIDNKKVEVTPKEFEILSYLIKNRNIAISREQLLSNIWGYDYFGDDRTIDTHMKMLRASLGRYRNHLVTVRRIGYKFVENEED